MVVISVSGGGEISPNTASRISSIKMLEKKGYYVTYERMFVMPSNCVLATKESLSILILEVLPNKVEQVIDDILSNVPRRTKPLFIDRIISKVGELEKPVARFLGRYIKVSNVCNSCG